jgi:hypothetical protein
MPSRSHDSTSCGPVGGKQPPLHDGELAGDLGWSSSSASDGAAHHPWGIVAYRCSVMVISQVQSIVLQST